MSKIDMQGFDLNKYPTEKDLWLFAKNNGYEQTAILLRLYVLLDQPDQFVPEFTTRSLCRIASMGIDNVPLEQDTGGYLNTNHGPSLYCSMWGGL